MTQLLPSEWFSCNVGSRGAFLPRRSGVAFYRFDTALEGFSMIHSVPSSIKFKHLLTALEPEIGCPNVTAETVICGLLERLWHFTATSAPRGDVGRFSDADIAVMAGWRGKPEVLIDALVTAGWLDRDDEFRLLVHDWSDHAPYYIKRNIGRKGGFATPKALDASMNSGDSKSPELVENPKRVSDLDSTKPSTESFSGDLMSQKSIKRSHLTKPNLTKPNLTISKRTKRRSEKRFTPPCADTVLGYAREYEKSKTWTETEQRDQSNAFVDFYESKGWLVGKNKMRDWKAAWRGWANRRKDSTPPADQEREKLNADVQRTQQLLNESPF